MPHFYVEYCGMKNVRRYSLESSTGNLSFICQWLSMKTWLIKYKNIYIILKLIICMVLIELQVNLSCSLTTFTVCLTEIVTWSDIQYIRSKNKNYPIYSPELSELISTYFSVSLQSQENVKEQWGLLMKLSKVGVNPQTVPIRHPFKIFFSKWLVSLFQKIRFKW